MVVSYSIENKAHIFFNGIFFFPAEVLGAEGGNCT